LISIHVIKRPSLSSVIVGIDSIIRVSRILAPGSTVFTAVNELAPSRVLLITGFYLVAL
jgi:hypothetical protein